MKFVPVLVHPLTRAQPSSTWRNARSVKIELGPAKHAELRFYVDPATQIESEMGDVHAFLQDQHALYEIGFASSYGVKDVQVSGPSRALRGPQHVELYGAWGAAGDGLRSIGFDRQQQMWVCLLEEFANATLQLDLDGDGQKEIVARFGAAADITIYRWHRDHFESVDVAQALGTDYAQLFEANGKWMVEVGQLIHGQSAAVRHFRYASGKLQPLSRVPEKAARRYF